MGEKFGKINEICDFLYFNVFVVIFLKISVNQVINIY